MPRPCGLCRLSRPTCPPLPSARSLIVLPVGIQASHRPGPGQRVEDLVHLLQAHAAPGTAWQILPVSRLLQDAKRKKFSPLKFAQPHEKPPIRLALVATPLDRREDL